eukprot:gene4143-9448_t
MIAAGNSPRAADAKSKNPRVAEAMTVNPTRHGNWFVDGAERSPTGGTTGETERLTQPRRPPSGRPASKKTSQLLEKHTETATGEKADDTKIGRMKSRKKSAQGEVGSPPLLLQSFHSVNPGPQPKPVKFDNVLVGMPITMRPGCLGHTQESNRFKGEVIDKPFFPDVVVIRWNDPKNGGPPAKFEVPKVSQELKGWWDGDGRPTTTAEQKHSAPTTAEQKHAAPGSPRAAPGSPRAAPGSPRGGSAHVPAAEDFNEKPTHLPAAVRSRS